MNVFRVNGKVLTGFVGFLVFVALVWGAFYASDTSSPAVATHQLPPVQVPRSGSQQQQQQRSVNGENSNNVVIPRPYPPAAPVNNAPAPAPAPPPTTTTTPSTTTTTPTTSTTTTPSSSSTSQKRLPFSLYPVDRKDPASILSQGCFGEEFPREEIFAPSGLVPSSCKYAAEASTLLSECRSKSASEEVKQRMASPEYIARYRALQNVRCPDPWVGDGHYQETLIYSMRANDGFCRRHGQWAGASISDLACTHMGAGIRHNYRPGDLIFDWGAGCGHAMTWMSAYFNVYGLGLDVSDSSIYWAANHSMGLYCNGNGADMTWLPDDLFDHVFSFAAVYHLKPEEQCHVMKESVRIIRPGGTVWIGWNGHHVGSSSISPEEARACLQAVPGIDFSVEDENQAFGGIGLVSGMYSVFITKRG